MTRPTVVPDANIPIRAVLGDQVRRLIEDQATSASFVAPDTAHVEARTHLPVWLRKRGVGQGDGSGASVFP